MLLHLSSHHSWLWPGHAEAAKLLHHPPSSFPTVQKLHPTLKNQHNIHISMKNNNNNISTNTIFILFGVQ